MAEQNRKTNSERALRDKAQEIVDDFIDYKIAIGAQTDIANEGRHILGTYSDHGSLPKGSGFSGFCTLASRIDRIRRQEITSRMIEAAKVMDYLKEDLQLAVCVDKGLRGKTRTIAQDPLNEKYIEITYSIQWCAERLQIDPATYRKRVSRAYKQIESVLQSYSQAA